MRTFDLVRLLLFSQHDAGLVHALDGIQLGLFRLVLKDALANLVELRGDEPTPEPRQRGHDPSAPEATDVTTQSRCARVHLRCVRLAGGRVDLLRERHEVRLPVVLTAGRRFLRQSDSAVDHRSDMLVQELVRALHVWRIAAIERVAVPLDGGSDRFFVLLRKTRCDRLDSVLHRLEGQRDERNDPLAVDVASRCQARASELIQAVIIRLDHGVVWPQVLLRLEPIRRELVLSLRDVGTNKRFVLLQACAGRAQSAAYGSLAGRVLGADKEVGDEDVDGDCAEEEARHGDA